MIFLIVLTALLLIVSIIGIIYIIKHSEDKTDVANVVFPSIILGAIIDSVLITFLELKEPKAIDVYRDKTELQVEGYYRDSTFVVTDSVVVYKEKI